MEQLPSAKPYLLRGMVQWIEDNGFTPQVLVDATQAGVLVPPEHVQAGKIVLNISVQATHRLEITNDQVSFSARFGGVARDIWVPMPAVLAVYARENGQGLTFPPVGGAPPPQPEPEAPPPDRPRLRVIK